MSRYQELHAEEAELTRRYKLTPTEGLEAKLKAVRSKLAEHHDELFRIDTSPEAVSRRLGLPYIGPQRPGSDFKDEGSR